MTNREIKFRVWDKENKIWRTEQAYTRCLIDQFGQVVFWDPRFTPEVKDQNIFVILQFTGLYDIHNKEIYEGDIVKTPDYKGPGDLLTVVFKNGCFGFDEFHYYKTFNDIRNIEVVGNIYEPPEP